MGLLEYANYFRSLKSNYYFSYLYVALQNALHHSMPSNSDYTENQTYSSSSNYFIILYIHHVFCPSKEATCKEPIMKKPFGFSYFPQYTYSNETETEHIFEYIQHYSQTEPLKMAWEDDFTAVYLYAHVSHQGKHVVMYFPPLSSSIIWHSKPRKSSSSSASSTPSSAIASITIWSLLPLVFSIKSKLHQISFSFLWKLWYHVKK